MESATSLIKNHRVGGIVRAGQFIPQHYEDQKKDAVMSFMRSNQYVTKKMLKDNKVGVNNIFFQCYH